MNTLNYDEEKYLKYTFQRYLLKGYDYIFLYRYHGDAKIPWIKLRGTWFRDKNNLGVCLTIDQQEQYGFLFKNINLIAHADGI